MMTDTFTQTKPTMMQQIKKFNVSTVKNYFAAMNLNFMELGMFAAIGLLTGFLFKKYFQMFMVTIILGVGLIAGLDHFGMIHIDWNAVSSLMGNAPSHNVDTLVQSALGWAKMNKILVSCFGVGFVFGFKVG